MQMTITRLSGSLIEIEIIQSVNCFLFTLAAQVNIPAQLGEQEQLTVLQIEGSVPLQDNNTVTHVSAFLTEREMSGWTRKSCLSFVSP